MWESSDLFKGRGITAATGFLRRRATLCRRGTLLGSTWQREPNPSNRRRFSRRGDEVGSGQSIQQFSLRPISRRVTQRLHTPTSHCPFLLGCPPCLTHHPTISSTQPHLTTPRMMKTDKKMDKLRNQNRIRSPHLPRRRHHRQLPWKELTDELVQSNTSSLRPCRCPTNELRVNVART